MSFTVDFAVFEPYQYFFQQAQYFVTLINGALSKNKRLIAKRKKGGDVAAKCWWQSHEG